jgi:hypothetical protein
MDIVIRVIIMLAISVYIPFVANIIYEPLRNKEAIKELNIIEKIGYAFLFFLLNWFIIAPAAIFMECFKYVFF